MRIVLFPILPIAISAIPKEACIPLYGIELAHIIVVVTHRSLHTLPLLGPVGIYHPRDCACQKHLGVHITLSENKSYFVTRVHNVDAVIVSYDPSRLPRPHYPPTCPDPAIAQHFPLTPYSVQKSDILNKALNFLIDHHTKLSSETVRPSFFSISTAVYLNPNHADRWGFNLLYFTKQYFTSTRDLLSNLYQSHKGIDSINSLWLAINDRIFGIAFAFWIIHPSTQLLVSSMMKLTLEWLQDGVWHLPIRTLSWFMSYPAGLKLNGPYSRFLGELGQWTVVAWAQGPLVLVSKVLMCSAFPKMIAILSFLGGFSLVVSIIVGDLFLGVCVAHLEALHIATSKLIRAKVRGLYALLSLFSVQLWNPLRMRKETAEFTPDQLLMGTLVFTMLVFLAPTTAVFWLYFNSIHIAIIIIRLALGVILWTLHTFPLLLVALRFQAPWRLPGQLRITSTIDGSGYVISNDPIPWSAFLYTKTPILVVPNEG